MARVKSQLWAIVVASSLLSSTVGIEATERDPASAGVTPGQQEQFRASILRAVASRPLGRGQALTTRRDVAQEPVQPQPSRVSRGCSCGMPTWLKYTLVGAAAAAGGYGLSRVGHHGGDGGNDKDPKERN